MSIFEGLANLSIKMLRENFVIPIGELGRFTFQGGGDGPSEVHAAWSPETSCIALCIKQKGQGKIVLDQSFGVDCVVDGQLRRWYFVCPETGLRVVTLYFRSGRFMTRHQLQGRYLSQDRWRPPRGAARDVPARPAAQRERRVWRASPVDGAPYEPVEVERGWEPWPPGAVQNVLYNHLSHDMRFAPPLSDRYELLPWEDQPRIDVKPLARRDMIEPGERTPISLRWPLGFFELHMFVGSDASQRHLVGLLWKEDGKDCLQRIELVESQRNGRPRYLFRCPVTEEPKEVLAYRAGRFASREAQRLKYWSQFKADGWSRRS